MTWWKFIYDAKTSTWGAYGRVAFVQADTEEAARVAALAEAQREYPQSQIEPFAIGASTPEAAAAFAERRARWQEWQRRSLAGIPNERTAI